MVIPFYSFYYSNAYVASVASAAKFKKKKNASLLVFNALNKDKK